MTRTSLDTVDFHPAVGHRPKVAIVILNWNGLNDTLECLQSVYRLDYNNFEVIIVDNGSSDNSTDILPLKYPSATLIRNRFNLGYTGGNNVGIRLAIKRRAQYIWLLNNDTIVDSQCLNQLVAQASKLPSIGILSPIVRHYDEPRALQFCGAYADVNHFSFKALHQPVDHFIGSPGQYFVQWGTALLIHRSVIYRIGLLNDKYFAYFEDYDYSVRASIAGYKSMVVSSALIYHKDSRSTGSRRAPIQVHLRVRNEFFFWMGLLAGPVKIKFFRHYFANTLILAAALRKDGFDDSAHACLNGWWSAIRNIGGAVEPSVKFPAWLRKILFWHVHMWIGLIRGNYLKTTKLFLNRIRR